MRATWIACLLIVGVALSAAPRIASAQLVLIGQEGTVDSDGDGVPDFVDNAPGVANNQADIDADNIGDVIDPTPNLSNPNLGDPALGIYPTQSILIGGTAAFDYATFAMTPPPGLYGHLLLDFGGNGSYEARYFGPLGPSINTLLVPANFFVDASWDLYTPGTYTLGMLAYAPGMQSQFVALPNVTVIAPEPATLVLVTLAGLASGWRRRR